MTPDEKRLEKILEALGKGKSELQKWYDIQSDINSGMDGYIRGVKQVSDLTKDLKTINENIEELKKKQVGLTGDELKLSKQKIAFLQLEYAKIEKNRDAIKAAIKDSKKWSMAAGAASAATLKAISNLDKIPNFITGKLGLLKGLFEMDKAIRTTVTQMGALGKQSDIVRQNIKSAAVNTISFGASIKEIAEIQAQYTESLGRNVILSQKSLETIAEIGKSTGLGLESATEMAVQFDQMGVSADMTGKIVQETLDRSSSMGLNATKVMKNLSQNFKMLNRYRFKEGIKGITKMAEMATKLGVEMDFAAAMSDKLWNVEGAVEMSAQLNVMGGAWAQMADPFKLMYQARNDMQGLTEDIAKAASASMSFAADGSIQTNAMEMQRLKIIAEQTGLEYEKLVELGKTQFKLGKIEMQSSGLSDEMREFVANTAEFKDGKAYIQVEGGKKLLTRLNEADRKFIQSQINDKKTMKERAEAAQSFDEKFQNLINMVEITMLPIVEGLTEALDPLVKDLMGPKSKFKDDLVELGKNIGEFVKWAAQGLGKFIGTVVDLFGAKGLFYTYLVGKTALWLANGYLLAQGFLAGVRPFMASFGGKGGVPTTGTPTGKNPINPATGKPFRGRPPKGGFQGPTPKGGFGTNFKSSFGSSGNIAGGVLAGGLSAYSEYEEQRERGKSRGEAAGRAALKGVGAGGGAMAGMAAGAAIGAAFGGVGAIPGAILGLALGSLGAYAGGELADLDNYGVEDGLFEGSNKNRRAILQNGKITPLDKKDDLLALKKYGVAGRALGVENNGNNVMKVEFGEMVINGEIKVMLPGGTQIGTELLKSQDFKTAITRVVQSQINKNINGGKN